MKFNSFIGFSQMFLLWRTFLQMLSDWVTWWRPSFWCLFPVLESYRNVISTWWRPSFWCLFPGALDSPAKRNSCFLRKSFPFLSLCHFYFWLFTIWIIDFVRRNKTICRFLLLVLPLNIQMVKLDNKYSSIRYDNRECPAQHDAVSNKE